MLRRIGKSGKYLSKFLDENDYELFLQTYCSSIAGEMSLSMARAGFLQTVFALVYATGQLVNGTVVDHVNPAKYMLVGIT